ncbi:mitochondrion biogenesis protein [Grosmannia clavigera kw1407]|uniref:Maintenance of mitochondrial morphology protein 1 n=1 Tax=Grosmannia clavigera (strain kw1407 / UAMH 11150) TaxID=655863 RepID=F0XPQ7_GROCL|nr:mitochondrion biogenesis protein [Grosmannia clavigera kw1407]EFX00226.1 mitochondrion biogenesis protein [Grosmannia clavigera kw1407]
MAPDNCPAGHEPTLSFSQGLIVGQLSVVLLVAAFIKFFIFGDPPSAEAIEIRRAAERRSRTEAHKESLLRLRSIREEQSGDQQKQQQQQPSSRHKSGVLRRPPSLTIGSILSKTYYRVDSHQPESLDWFNVLIAQTIAQFRNDAQHDDAILASLTKALNGDSRPDFVDEIRVTELSLGEDFPIFSNCRIIPVDEDGLGCGAGGSGGPKGTSSPAARLQARMDVDLSDMITLAVETRLLLNYPRRLSAVLPVALAVSVVRFSGTLSVSFVPSNPSQATPTRMIFAFLDDYRLDFSIRSLLGSRSRLQDVPKIAQLIESRLHRWFDDRAVEPRFQEIALPSLWPRMKNARGGDGKTSGGPPSEDVASDSAAATAAGLSSKAATGGRPESRDSRDSRDTRDTRDQRDPRRDADTETWLQHQQPHLQGLPSAAAVALAQPGQVPHLANMLRPSQDSLRHRQRSRYDDVFSMPGSLPDSMDPRG